jgi:GTP pyrophosphokinase
MGPDGRWVEVQIRTERMDGVAEKGIAAHWLYKESTEGFEEHLADWISQVRDILENPSLNALEAVKEFRENIGQSDIYVFTPQGEMKRLPANSTAIDFAYKIHTNIGDTAIGAKVDNRVVTLDYNLKQADQIEIINSKKARPKEEWLDFARTSRAREGIKSALRRQRKELVDTGQKIFLRGARQFGVDEDHPYMKELLAFFRKATIEDFYFAIGNRQIAAERFQHFIELKRDGQSVDSEIWSEEEEQKVLEEKRLRNLGVDIDTLTVGKMNGIDNYEIADCCKPIPGDTILGFHDRNRVFIHRTTCSEAISLMSNYGSQIINTKWAEDQIGITFLAGLKVVGLDRQGMLNDLLRVISQKMKLNLRTVTIDSREGMFEGLFKVYVHNTDELDRLKKNLKELPHVYTVSRAERDFIPFQEGG